MRRRTSHTALRGLAAFAAVVTLVVHLADAAAPSDALDDAQKSQVLLEAQQAYDRGVAALRRDPDGARQQFEAAAERFAVLVDGGIENGRLYYNLGNAQLQAGRIGAAIVSYRRAQRLIPGDPRLQSNLDYARSLVERRIEPVGGRALTRALLAWHHQTSLSLRVGVFAVAYLALWTAIGVLLWRWSTAALWRAAAVAAAVVAIVTGASVAASLAQPVEGEDGVVRADEVVVRKGNGDGYEPRFEQPLVEGVEFSVLERRGGWLHIELRDGNTGWIRATDATLI